MNMEPIAVLWRLEGVTMANDLPQPLELVVDQGIAAVVVDFRAFFADHHRPIATALAMTLRDDTLAADATAEAMTRAYERWDEVGTYTNPAGWTYRVGLNWALSRRRKLTREIVRADSPDRAAPPVVVEPELDDALAALPVEQRTVVVLRYLLDWSEFQTAEALDIAPGTVKSRLSRALDRLATLLEKPDDA
jgi:RNA polymerase sigma-70 factor (ECF subfamily)